ncbi:MAG: porin PorA family protein [Betaproteobacteria bacterium]
MDEAQKDPTAEKSALMRALRNSPRAQLFIAVAFCLLAALLRWWVAPELELLPADYVSETSYAANLRSRETPSSPALETENIVRRRDQTLNSSDSHCIIQGDAHWSTLAGSVIFETRNLYGVDRRNRQNLPGYGNESRTGQYLFPPHTEKRQYGMWDPLYGGPYVAAFESVEQWRGLEVYVFKFLADGIDETAGYASRPDVPEKYRVLTYGQGRFWVEPVSGVVVDHEDAGVSYLIEPKTSRREGEPINEWKQRYTHETVEAQLKDAKATRWRMHALEVWLPVAFLPAGLFAMTLSFLGRRKK